MQSSISRLVLLTSFLLASSLVPGRAGSMPSMLPATSALPQASTCGGTTIASADATVIQDAPRQNTGADPSLFVQEGARTARRLLLRFNLGQRPAEGVTVQSATLELRLVSGTPVSYTLDVRAITGSWNESTVTWADRPSAQVTYARPSATTTPGTLRIDVSSLVTHWMTGTIREVGIALFAVTPGQNLRFVSREGAGRDSAAAPRLIVRCAARASAIPVDPTAADARQATAISRLQQQSKTPIVLKLQRGAVRFARFQLPIPASAGVTNIGRALWLVEDQRDLLRLADPERELQLVRRDASDQHLVFRQRHAGLPVFPAELIVHLDNGVARGMEGSYIPEITLSPVPRLSRQQAEALALLDQGGSVAGDTQLRYINREPLGFDDPMTYLAWQVSLSGGRPSLFVDANTGTVLYRQQRAFNDFDLDLEHGNGEPSEELCSPFDNDNLHPGTQRYIADPDAQPATSNMLNVYNWWRLIFGRDSYDGDGEQIEVNIHTSFPSPNASYNAGCDIFFFGDGMPAGLDIVSHEFMHAVVEKTVPLEYLNQSGAVNEHLADLFGYLVEAHFNGNGDDWLIGEDVPTGPFRDMRDPPAMLDPDHMLATVSGDNQGFRTLAAGVEADCAPNGNDCGFVHTNSSILNKAAYLLISGGQFRNFNMFGGIGRGKAALLFYRILLHKHLPSSNKLLFEDLRNVVVWEVDAIVNNPQDPDHANFTPQDTCIVRNAYAAVGLGSGDRDCDRVEDVVDLDSDGDTFPDAIDTCPLIKNSSNTDTDGDGQGNQCDADDDNDGVTDTTDNCRVVANPSQANFNNDPFGDACGDADGDTIADLADNCRTNKNPDQLDSNGDGQGNVCDVDDDGDGILDDGDGSGKAGDHPCSGGAKTSCDDNSPLVPNPDQADQDADGVGTATDNCPSHKNSDNEDIDGDALGDACDPDDDADAICDLGGPRPAGTPGTPLGGCKPGVAQPSSPFVYDNCRQAPNPDQLDVNKNGIGSACDGSEPDFDQLAVYDSKLTPNQHLEIPIDKPNCLACGDYLPPGAAIHLEVTLPLEFEAQVVDSQGFTVAKGTGNGLTQSLDFEMAPFALDTPAQGVAEAASTQSLAPLAPDQTRYRLLIFPTGTIDPARMYRVQATLETNLPAATFLPLLRR